ncbi:hypothetical protein [Humibacter ginsenosidimutans]|uniref:Uncharacterized protein n=1 Tax=Humibacter ginsenosidimutans TaxID=2599293 RepID=A0A5B8M5K5_9MICO|nr:hypothetical protein [Humibacter ginsenosidimutans]QDZ14872.1 hypothetical protein FPZ11_08965 [Humibacter ginsenosidimutans]
MPPCSTASPSALGVEAGSGVGVDESVGVGVDESVGVGVEESVGVGVEESVGVGVGVGVGVDPLPDCVEPPTVAGPVVPGPQTSVLLEVLLDDELVTVPVVGSTVVVGVLAGAEPLVMWQFEPYGDVVVWCGTIVARTPFGVCDTAPTSALITEESTGCVVVVVPERVIVVGVAVGVTVGVTACWGTCTCSVTVEDACGSAACAGPPITTLCASARASAASAATSAKATDPRRAPTTAESMARPMLVRASRATIQPRTDPAALDALQRRDPALVDSY